MKATQERVELLRRALATCSAFVSFDETSLEELRVMADEMEAQVPKPLKLRDVWRSREDCHTARVLFDRELTVADLDEVRRVLTEKFSMKVLP